MVTMPLLRNRIEPADLLECCISLFIRSFNNACNRSVRRARGQRFKQVDRDAILALLFLDRHKELCEKLRAAHADPNLGAALSESRSTVPRARTKRKAPPRGTDGRFKKRAA